MRLSPKEFAQVLGILDAIDSQRIQPRFPGRVGRFLRQYATSRDGVDAVLDNLGRSRREDGAVSGQGLGAIEIHPLVAPDVVVLEFPLREVAAALCLSEELGAICNLVLWLKGPSANAIYNLIRTPVCAVRLDGDFRWTPVGRVTPGTAVFETVSPVQPWEQARFLRAVAEDIDRPPHALEYVLDRRIGPAGLKSFRSVAARRDGRGWEVLSAFGPPKALNTGVDKQPCDGDGLPPGVNLAMLLVFREPWSSGWRIARARPIGSAEALAHCLEWADFQWELQGSAVDFPRIHAIQANVRRITPSDGSACPPRLGRRLAPLARRVVRWMRGIG